MACNGKSYGCEIVGNRKDEKLAVRTASRIVCLEQGPNAFNAQPKIIEICFLGQYASMHHGCASAERLVKSQTVVRTVAEHEGVELRVLAQPSRFFLGRQFAFRGFKWRLQTIQQFRHFRLAIAT